MSQPLTSQPVHSEFYSLLSAWADGALSDDEFVQLDSLLKDSAEHRQAYARYVRMCQSLPDLVVPEFNSTISPPPSTRVGETAGQGQSSVIPALPPPAPLPRVRGRGGPVFSRRSQTRAFIVAGLILLALVGAVSWLRPRSAKDLPVAVHVPARQAGSQVGSVAAAVPTDSHLAVVTGIENAVWEADSLPLEIGAALESQVLRLTSGTVDIESDCGASLRLRGPSEFALISKSRGKLVRGTLSALVPEYAHGFTIDTPSVEVVDLGTEFGISVDQSGVSDVHVFRGLVETRMPSSDEQPGSLERLTADQTRRFNPGSSESTSLSFDGSRFVSPPERYRDEPTTQGAISLLREPPRSLAVGALESNEFILLFLERRDVALTRSVPVSLSLPGRYDRFRGKDGKLKPPLRVDSYLLHFDALNTPRSYAHLRLDGSVTFPRPILGVIARGQALSLTDSMFGSTSVEQSEARSRGLDRKAEGDNLDVVTLSEDRRTLHVSFSVGGSCDQLRILVQAEQQP